MDHIQDIKKTVQERYNQEAIGQEEALEESCGCGSGCGCSSTAETSGDYTDLEGYHPYADLGLGCGLPTEFIEIKDGQTVVDLGCGAGNDCFVAREKTGTSGKVIGIDITGAMIERARRNAEMAGYNNVEFRHGDILDVPVTDQTAHAVVLNCVLNLVDDRERVLSEAYRIMKHHGHLGIADVVAVGDVPAELREDAEMYVGCLTGLPEKEEFLGLVAGTGFEDARIADMKPVPLPDAMLRYHLDDAQLAEYQKGMFGLFTVTVVAEKPCCKSGKEDHDHHGHHHSPGHAHACACGNH